MWDLVLQDASVLILIIPLAGAFHTVCVLDLTLPETALVLTFSSVLVQSRSRRRALATTACGLGLSALKITRFRSFQIPQRVQNNKAILGSGDDAACSLSSKEASQRSKLEIEGEMVSCRGDPNHTALVQGQSRRVCSMVSESHWQIGTG